MSGLELFLPWCQAFAFFPVKEASLFLATVEPGGSITKMPCGQNTPLSIKAFGDGSLNAAECRDFDRGSDVE
jgi:hypothetical protein